jgi:hypothetical protein
MARMANVAGKQAGRQPSGLGRRRLRCSAIPSGGLAISIRFARVRAIIPFRPRQQQLQIIDLIYRQGCRRVIILKARQLGFSTLLGVVCADRLCFGMGQQISLIDQTLEDARQKLRDITLVAYESLDPALKKELPITRSNTGELAVKFTRHEEAKSNTMFAGTHARGGANSFLWVSEWGVIQATDLARSEEILTGALPSVGDGVCVVETTWRGGRNGHLWSLVKSALETPEARRDRSTGAWSSFPGKTSRPIAMRFRGGSARRRSDTSRTSRMSPLASNRGINASAPNLACSSNASIRPRSRSASKRRWKGPFTQSKLTS